MCLPQVPLRCVAHGLYCCDTHTHKRSCAVLSTDSVLYPINMGGNRLTPLSCCLHYFVRKEAQRLILLCKIRRNRQRGLQSCEACALGMLLGRSCKIA